MKKHTLVTALLFSCLSAIALNAGSVIVFDIHGVLLRDDIASLVQRKIALLFAQNRGMGDNPLVKELNELMTMCRPLGQPTAEYSPSLGVPYEIYALFAGIKSPDEVRSAVLAMIANTPLDPKKALMFEALIDTTFNNVERVSALVAIPTTAALLKSLLSDPNNQVYIYSNAPAEWVNQYRTLFPDIFAGIPHDHLMCSGSTGFIKPSKAAFEAICAEANCEISDIILIDDSQQNCETLQQLGGTALRCFTPKPLSAGASITNTQPK